MKGKINKLIALAVTYACTKNAFKVSASACSLNFYQPKEPKCLKK